MQSGVSNEFICVKCRKASTIFGNEYNIPSCSICGVALPWLHDGTDISLMYDIQAPVPVIVDFWATWCAPCHIMGSILDELAHEMAGKVRIVKINVDENPESSSRFDVRSVPTLIIFKGGEIVDQIIGLTQKEMLIERVKHLHQIG